MEFEPLYLRIKEQIRKDWCLPQSDRGLERMPTLNELQEQYGVSRPTISKALASLAAEGVLVKEAGRGMFALPAASDPEQALPPARKIIGYIAPLYGAELSQDVFSGIDRVAQRRGWRVLMASSGDSMEHERAAAQEMIAAGAQGLVIYPALRHGSLQEKEYLRTEDLGVPLVLVDTCTRDQGHTQIIFDNRRAGAQITNWLLEQGRRRIGLAFYQEDMHHPGLDARYQGYIGALKEFGLSVDSQLVHRDQYDNAGSGLGPVLDEWFSLPEPPDAIIAMDDMAALSMTDQLAARGVRVPDDVLVAGFDNRVAARRFQPAFVTTAPDFEDLGGTACETLLDGVQSGDLPPQVYVLPVPLLVRIGAYPVGGDADVEAIFARRRGVK
jgi:DNA-binding LacI/PurR family transcriptional regulator